MIRIEQLHKLFGKLHVLKGVNISFNKQEVACIIGPNGSGKSTLIKCILGMNIPNEGNILINHQNINREFEYRRNIGYMPQIGSYPENIKMGQLFDMMKDLRKPFSTLDEDLVHQFKLSEMFNKPMGTLSGGTIQKVSAALAFLFNPNILILDEPTAGLDPVAVEILKEKIKLEKQKDKTIIITSHIMPEVEEIADTVIYILEGVIRFNKTIPQIKIETQEEKFSKAISKILINHS